MGERVRIAGDKFVLYGRAFVIETTEDDGGAIARREPRPGAFDLLRDYERTRMSREDVAAVESWEDDDG